MVTHLENVVKQVGNRWNDGRHMDDEAYLVILDYLVRALEHACCWFNQQFYFIPSDVLLIFFLSGYAQPPGKSWRYIATGKL